MTGKMCFIVSLIAMTGCLPKGYLETKKPVVDAGLNNKAQVVFLRVSRAGNDTGHPVTVWDGNEIVGHTAGVAQAFMVTMEPGKHRLVSVSEGNTDVIEADFEPGKLYYIYIMYTDFFVSRTAHLNPLYEDAEKWKHRSIWLKRAHWVALDPENIDLWKKYQFEQVKKALVKFDPNGDNSKRAVLREHGIDPEREVFLAQR